MGQTLILSNRSSPSPLSSLNVKNDQAWIVGRIEGKEKKMAMDSDKLKDVQNVPLTFI